MLVFFIYFFILLWFILFFIPIYSVKNSENKTIIPNSLEYLFKAQNFHNIIRNTSIPGLLLIEASSHGENYLFAQKNNMIQFSITDINKIYQQAEKSHIHNIVILPLAHASLPNTILEKIKEYNIQIWDNSKIYSLISSPSTNSILSTSDTSADKCKIDTNYFNPIQEPSSFWKNILRKPDRL